MFRRLIPFKSKEVLKHEKNNAFHILTYDLVTSCSG